MRVLRRSNSLQRGPAPIDDTLRGRQIGAVQRLRNQKGPFFGRNSTEERLESAGKSHTVAPQKHTSRGQNTNFDSNSRFAPTLGAATRCHADLCQNKDKQTTLFWKKKTAEESTTVGNSAAAARYTIEQTYVSAMRGKEDLSLAGLVGSDPHQTIPSANDNTPAGKQYS